MVPMLKIRRLALDVDQRGRQAALVEMAETITACSGVEAVNITITSMDVGTVGMDVTIEGQFLDYGELVKAVEERGAVVLRVGHIACGERSVERIARAR